MKFRKFQSNLAIDRDECDEAEGRPICESEAREFFWCVLDGARCTRSRTCATLVLSARAGLPGRGAAGWTRGAFFRVECGRKQTQRGRSASGYRREVGSRAS